MRSFSLDCLQSRALIFRFQFIASLQFRSGMRPVARQIEDRSGGLEFKKGSSILLLFLILQETHWNFPGSSHELCR